MGRYSRKLTKEELIAGGITEITPDCRVFKGKKEVEFSILNSGNRRYLGFSFNDTDEAGNKIKLPRQYSYTKKDGSVNYTDSYVYQQRVVALSRAVWAWHYGQVDEGYVIDHINNNLERLIPENNSIDKLQMILPKENINKDRTSSDMKLKCRLNVPISFYEEKLAKYEADYEQAKADHNADLAHKKRGNIAQIRAKIRYYEEHLDEAYAMALKKENDRGNHDRWKLEVAAKKGIKILKQKLRDEGKVQEWRELVAKEKLIPSLSVPELQKFAEIYPDGKEISAKFNWYDEYGKFNPYARSNKYNK